MRSFVSTLRYNISLGVGIEILASILLSSQLPGFFFLFKKLLDNPHSIVYHRPVKTNLTTNFGCLQPPVPVEFSSDDGD